MVEGSGRSARLQGYLRFTINQRGRSPLAKWRAGNDAHERCNLVQSEAALLMCVKSDTRMIAIVAFSICGRKYPHGVFRLLVLLAVEWLRGTQLPLHKCQRYARILTISSSSRTRRALLKWLAR